MQYDDNVLTRTERRIFALRTLYSRAGYRSYRMRKFEDYDLYSRVKLVVISCLLVKTLGRDLTETAQLFSKEVENDADNVDALLDAAYEHPAFTDDKLLYMLLSE